MNYDPPPSSSATDGLLACVHYCNEIDLAGDDCIRICNEVLIDPIWQEIFMLLMKSSVAILVRSRAFRKNLVRLIPNLFEDVDVVLSESNAGPMQNNSNWRALAIEKYCLDHTPILMVVDELYPSLVCYKVDGTLSMDQSGAWCHDEEPPGWSNLPARDLPLRGLLSQPKEPMDRRGLGSLPRTLKLALVQDVDPILCYRLIKLIGRSFGYGSGFLRSLHQEGHSEGGLRMAEVEAQQHTLSIAALLTGGTPNCVLEVVGMLGYEETERSLSLWDTGLPEPIEPTSPIDDISGLSCLSPHREILRRQWYGPQPFKLISSCHFDQSLHYSLLRSAMRLAARVIDGGPGTDGSISELACILYLIRVTMRPDLPPYPIASWHQSIIQTPNIHGQVPEALVFSLALLDNS